MDEKTPNLEAGYSLGSYRILKKIGAGGMGEVYLAEDSRLRRKIALKVLHRDVDQDDERLRRFEQEALAASGLNHPNILTIYEFGAENEMHFLASEFVDGETLRDRMRRERLTIGETLHIAIQAAEALSAAHEAKIIHRDIKPENIMVRPDHLVKVLDFGLAKLAEKKIETVDSEAETIHGVVTEPGMIMGTFAYMSPEQSRGKETDARSDIWSLGCVMYEMICGKAPFAGETPADCLAAIIRQNPGSLALLNEEVPTQLEDIVGKCLEKDREERYQTVKDLLVDLRRLKRKLEFEVEKERSGSSEYITGEAQKTRAMPAFSTAVGPAQTVSSAEYLARGISRHKFVVLGILAFLALSAAGFALYKYGFFTRQAKASIFASPHKLKINRLGISGKVGGLAISPDGKYAAYVMMDVDKTSIRLRQTATNSDMEIVAPKDKENIGDLGFTPDGNQIYYVGYGENRGTIYKVPTIGGLPVKIAEKTSSGAGVSPDGESIAFIRYDENGENSHLQLADADGSNERTLLTTAEPDYLRSQIAPPWSPDGKTVLSVIINTSSPNDPFSKILAVNAADGSQRVFNERNWSDITDIVWLPDGSLIVCGSEKKSTEQFAPGQLWLIAPGGEPQRVTNDLNNYIGASVGINATGEILVTTQFKSLNSLWISPAGDTARAEKVPNYPGLGGKINWTPDGKFVFCSDDAGNLDIGMMNADGTGQKQLTTKKNHNCSPSMTKDGHFIVFLSTRAGTQHVFRMDADGGNPKQLTSGERKWSVRLSSDGNWVYYAEATPGDEPVNICKVSIQGGEPVVIGKVHVNFFFQIDVSPRDEMIAYEYYEDKQAGGGRKIGIMGADGAVIKTLTLPPTARFGPFRWTQDGRAIAFVDYRDPGNIWTVALEGNGNPKPLTKSKGEPISGFAWSLDGKQLAILRGTVVTETLSYSEAK